MSIKPIDAQVMLHNSPDAARLQNPHRNENAQAQAAQGMQKKIEHDENDVAKTNEASEAKINQKQQEEKRERNKKKKDNKNSNEENKSNGVKRSTTSGSTSTIDIRI